MYWTSEDIQPSVDLAEKLFGKSGIMAVIQTQHTQMYFF